MACSFKSFCSSNQAFCRQNLSQYPKIRFENFRENGKKKGGNIVDANLSVLRERIQQVRKREERLVLHTPSPSSSCGWNYKQNYDPKHKRERDRDNNYYSCMASECAEIVGLACGAIGFVFLIGSIALCLVSLLVYLSISI